MDDRYFDALTRRLTTARVCRRTIVGILASGAIAWSRGGTNITSARKRKQKKQKKRKQQKQRPPVLNAFGCVAIGLPCRGDSALCCSGICQGAPPRQGKPDTSVCIAHNAANCSPERGFCATGDDKRSVCGTSGICVATTGNAGFCASDDNNSPEINCRVCGSDADCVAQGFPPGSACAVLTGGFCVGENNCVDVNGSNGTACLVPDPGA
jgi:hypothetical protein